MKNKEFYALGIMSGTSIDGLDFSLIKSDGKDKIQILINHYFKFSPKIKLKINDFIKKNQLSYNFSKNSSSYERINREFSLYLLKKIKIFFSLNNFDMDDVDVIGIHGNTILHRPSKGFSIQLGSAKMIAEKLKKPIVCNFRNKDISLGGEGAPLVPVFHRAIFSKRNNNIVVINIGGISNFTFLEGEKNIFASDIGPGNSLIDKLCIKYFKKDFDRGGKLAKKGNFNPKHIEELENKIIFKKKFPISFDSKDFDLKSFYLKDLNEYDNLRTLTYLTAKIISNLKKRLSKNINYWVFSGGGTKNSTMMSDLRKLLKNEIIFVSDDLGYHSSFIESSAFAYISIRTMINLPSAFPSTTGCSEKNICGEIIFP